MDVFDRLEDLDAFDWMENLSEDEEDVLVTERRQYTMAQRINMTNWDDYDFFVRFRLHKETVAQILQMILPSLTYNDDK